MMGNFACLQCNGEFFIPRISSMDCPNCGIHLDDMTKTIQEKVREEAKQGWDDQGTPVEYVVHPDPLEAQFSAVLDQARALWRERQKKYGPTNIAATGALGCLVRSTDKLARLREVYINGR